MNGSWQSDAVVEVAPRKIAANRAIQALYVPVLSVAMGLMFARMLVMAHMLDIEAFAEFSAVLLVSSLVTMLAAFGLYLDLQRELPVFYFRGDRHSAAALLGQALIGATGALVLCSLVALSGVQIAGVRSTSVLAGVLHGFSQQVFLIAASDGRSRGKPLLFAGENAARAVLILGVAIPVASLTGSALAVIYTEVVLTLVVTAAILVRVLRTLRFPLLTVFRMAIGRLHLLSPVSLGSLVLFSILSFLSTSADRWLAAELLSTPQFAIYAFAWTAMIIALSLQSVVNASFFPFMARTLAGSGTQAAFRLCCLAAVSVLAALLLLLMPAVYMSDWAIKAYFPRYEGAVVLLPVIGAAAAFRLSDFWSGFVILTGYERRALMAAAFTTAASLAGWALYGHLHRWQATPLEFAWLAFASAAVNYTILALLSWMIAKQKPDRSAEVETDRGQT